MFPPSQGLNLYTSNSGFVKCCNPKFFNGLREFSKAIYRGYIGRNKSKYNLLLLIMIRWHKLKLHQYFKKKCGAHLSFKFPELRHRNSPIPPWKVRIPRELSDRPDALKPSSARGDEPDVPPEYKAQILFSTSGRTYHLP